MIHAIITYAAMRGVKSVDRTVELCERDIAFIWLTKRQNFSGKLYDFVKQKLTDAILDDLHHQFLRRLQKEDLITPEVFFIDGTKIEANANRYTFVWRRSINQEDGHYYRCHDKRALTHIRTEASKQDRYMRTTEVYGCKNCSGCEHKARCLYNYDETRDANKNKVMKINEAWEELKSETHENIERRQGILNRHIRSIQTEGHFEDIKENDQFRRFNYRSSEKVYKKAIPNESENA